MPTRLSTVIGVSRQALEDKDVFDATIDFDSHLHIDPALLSRTTIREFVNARQKVSAYFNDILLLLSKSNGNDSLWRQAVRRLTFGEGLNSGLGYSKTGTTGSGIGPNIAIVIARIAKEIIDVGINDPVIFELVPLFESGIGPDRISDMMSLILKDEFIAFTNRVIRELGVTQPTNRAGVPFVFMPKGFLSNFPVVDSWEDVKIAAQYNEAIRASMSHIIGKSWAAIAKEYTKKDLKELLLKNPELFRALLANYKSRMTGGYDFQNDHLGVLLWDILGKSVVDQHQFDLTAYHRITTENVLEVVFKICEQYKKLIEHNGLVHHLYDDKGKRRPERFPQLLFFSVADSYCEANQLDLSREINAGSGALDFKVSKGSGKVNVELKYSTNPKLVEGFKKQLPTYNRAENVRDEYSIYLILKVNKRQNAKIEYVKNIVAERTAKAEPCPRLFIVDSFIKPSASKR